MYILKKMHLDSSLSCVQCFSLTAITNYVKSTKHQRNLEHTTESQISKTGCN